MRTFFSRRTDTKLALPKTDHIRGGLSGFQRYSLQASRGNRDLNEGYSIAPEFVERGRVAVDGEAGAAEVWPAESDEYGLRGFRSICREYYEYIEGLARMIADLIAEGLGLIAEYFVEYFERQMAHCQLIRCYAGPQSENENDGNDIGASLHTDWGLISILLQDDVGGLQFVDGKTDTYITVPPTPGAYVVNCGDLLTGLYTSARHRVIAPPPGTLRYSVPFFCDGNPDYLVDVLPLGEEWKAWVQGGRASARKLRREPMNQLRRSSR